MKKGDAGQRSLRSSVTHEGRLDPEKIDFGRMDDGAIPPEEYRAIVDWIQSIPELDPPQGLSDAVMEAVHSARLPWWRRALIWLRTPRTFTVTPFQGVSVLAGLLLLLVVSSAVMKSVDMRSTMMSENPTKSVPVLFVFDAPRARSVAVIGSFNQWRPEGFEMRWDDERNRWVLKVRLPMGRHEYAFLVNGEKVVPDPEAVLYEEDGFGQRNAVLLLGIDENDASRA